MNFGEHQLVQRIKERYCMPEFVTVGNVETPSGRYADAVAVNLWRSRGYEIIGFECKSVRGDWLREKANPEKAEGVAQFCRTFWIVANPNVVKLEELPAGWGLLEAKEKGLIQKQKATVLGHRREITVPMMISLIRRAVEKADNTAEVAAARLAGHAQGIEVGRAQMQTSHMKEVEAELARLKQLLVDFKARTGIELSAWSSAEKLGRVYRLVDRAEWIERSFQYTISNLKKQTKDVEQLLSDFQKGVGDADATET